MRRLQNQVNNAPTRDDLCELWVARTYTPPRTFISQYLSIIAQVDAGDSPVKILIPLPVNMLQTVHENKEIKIEKRVEGRRGKGGGSRGTAGSKAEQIFSCFSVANQLRAFVPHPTLGA